MTDVAPYIIDWDTVIAHCKLLAKQIKSSGKKYDSIYPIPRGGAVPGSLLSVELKLPLVNRNQITSSTLIVDDIADSGETLHKYHGNGSAVLVEKNCTNYISTFNADKVEGGVWVVFPWEQPDIEDDNSYMIRRLIEMIGDNPNREGITETPQRYIKALMELTSGYRQDEAEIFEKKFKSNNDQLVVIPNIEYYSLCEHHILPFFGHIHIGYVPAGEVLGLSKFSRLVDMYSRRLQLQERLAEQIADSIMTNLRPLGVGVVVEGKHLCVASRGIKKSGSGFITSCLLGILRTSTRDEFLHFIGK